jgi:hypothetical protein
MGGKKMIKTTLKEIKRNSSIEGRAEFKEFLKKNDLKPVKVDLIAYSVSVYGLGAYLAMFTLNNGLVVKVNTGNRSSWNYSVRNSDFGL